eukprot:Blabericola_migrator_1__10178@NODE_568_length_7541_cov_61_527562_g423_i0_p4_GENE_NODE_568_length_7541_cov_61_527562_g423_i0NODE_568_length_7541_cov_61_527562_g423_i0_p4_ORF_typecomplete_len121_score16_67_NODE_568_length_7541_cov_61_527562_g423_i08721234
MSSKLILNSSIVFPKCFIDECKLHFDLEESGFLGPHLDLVLVVKSAEIPVLVVTDFSCMEQEITGGIIAIDTERCGVDVQSSCNRRQGKNLVLPIRDLGDLLQVLRSINAVFENNSLADF